MFQGVLGAVHGRSPWLPSEVGTIGDGDARAPEGRGLYRVTGRDAGMETRTLTCEIPPWPYPPRFSGAPVACQTPPGYATLHVSLGN